jgi:hypothetical protein
MKYPARKLRKSNNETQYNSNNFTMRTTQKRNSNRLFFFLLAAATCLLCVSQTMAQSYDGYTLYFPQNGNKAYLVDLSGNPYHTWTFSSNSKTCYSTYLLSGGVLLRTVARQGNFFGGGPVSGEVQKVDWDGNVLWDFVYSTQEYCTHHDIHEMPNGNVLLIAYERKSAAEALQAGCSSSMEIWPDKITEIQPSGTSGGTVVWEWQAWDHLVQDHDATKDNYGVVTDHPELLDINYHTTQDWMHVNGIDYNEELDQIVFSSHALNEIYVIDHSTTMAEAASHSGGNSGKGGDILYRWGNPASYRASGTTDFNVVHDAHWIRQIIRSTPMLLSVLTIEAATVGNHVSIFLSRPMTDIITHLHPVLRIPLRPITGEQHTAGNRRPTTEIPSNCPMEIRSSVLACRDLSMRSTQTRTSSGRRPYPGQHCHRRSGIRPVL